MKTILAACVCLALAGGGCTTPTQGDKSLNDQNKKAGAFVAATAAEPSVRQAGADVRANSETLEKNLIGPPAEPKPYSSAASQKAREDSEAEHATPLWKLILGGAGTVLLTFLGQGWAARFFPMLLGGTAGKALGSVVEGVTRVRENAVANGGAVQIDDLLEMLKKAQGEEGSPIHKLIQELAHKAEAKLAAKL
jgi:hypothetical protein